MARKKPGRYDAGVNGLHGPSVRAPVDDDGGPGKLSLRVTTSHGEKAVIAAQCSGPNLRADEVSGRAVIGTVIRGKCFKIGANGRTGSGRIVG
jgi:hypothetical protein